MGLLGSIPDQKVLGQGIQNRPLISERQSSNFMEQSSAQQGRGILGTLPSAEETRFSQQAMVEQDRRLMQQNMRENQMRGNSVLQQPQTTQRMQQGMMGTGDGLLGEAPTSAMMAQPAGRTGKIPSLFELPSGRLQGKRPGDRINRPIENKKPRPAVSFNKLFRIIDFVFMYYLLNKSKL